MPGHSAYLESSSVGSWVGGEPPAYECELLSFKDQLLLEWADLGPFQWLSCGLKGGYVPGPIWG